MIRFLILTVLAVSTSAAALSFQSEPVVGEYRDWRVLDGSPNEEAAEFIDANSIVRTGQAVEFDVLTIYRQARRRLAPMPNYDNELGTMIADCGSKFSRTRRHFARLGDQETTPSIVEFGGNRGSPPPAPGTALDRRLRTACEEVPLAAIRIEDPYTWTRSHFQSQ